MINKKLVKTILGLAVIIVTCGSIWLISEAALNSNLGNKTVLANLEKASTTIDDVDHKQLAQDQEQLTKYTLEDLRKFSGENGQQSYIAVDDIIYDVTGIDVWEKGVHMGLKAGADLTEAFHSSPHALAVLDKALVVGQLVTSGQNADENNHVKDNKNDIDNSNSVEIVDENSALSDKKMTVSEFSKAELSLYNGINGAKAYIAVNGTVYDMTSVDAWRSGSHQGYESGQDLTIAFNQSPHSAAVLDQGIIVGKYLDEISTSSAQPSNQVNTSATITWTIERVSQFNGKDGAKSYIVVNNIIYDMSQVSAWSNGSHKGIEAGKDLTAAFSQSPHSASILDKGIIVGKIGDSIENLPVDNTVNNNNQDTNNDQDKVDHDEDEDDHDEDEDDHDEDEDEDDHDEDEDDHDEDEDNHDED